VEQQTDREIEQLLGRSILGKRLLASSFRIKSASRRSCFLLRVPPRESAGGMANPAFDSQLSIKFRNQCIDPVAFNAYKHWPRELRIELPHVVALVHQR